MKAYVELQSGTVLEVNDPAIWPEAKRLGAAEGKRRLKRESLDTLRELFPPGSTVWTKVTHVSRSGMSRNIQAFAIQDNEPRNVSGHVARVLEWPERHDAVAVAGCGMDMGFHLVHALGYALYRDGFDCVGDHCPSNDHSNRVATKRHTEGGYALRQRWI